MKMRPWKNQNRHCKTLIYRNIFKSPALSLSLFLFLLPALNLVIDILTQGHATLQQLAYLEKTVSNVTLGLVFWGTGQVFAKLLCKEKNT